MDRKKLQRKVVLRIVWYVLALLVVIGVIAGVIYAIVMPDHDIVALAGSLVFALLLCITTLWKSFKKSIKNCWKAKALGQKIIEGLFGTLFVVILYGVGSAFMLIYNMIVRIKPTTQMIKELRATAPKDEDDELNGEEEQEKTDPNA